MWVVHGLIHFTLRELVGQLLGKIFVVSLLALPLPFLVRCHTERWEALFATTAAFAIVFVPVAYWLGLDGKERGLVKSIGRKMKGKIGL
jgi:hypothetical protein